MTNLIEIKPMRRFSRNLEALTQVHASFPAIKSKNKNMEKITTGHYLSILIGSAVAGKIGLHVGDKVKLFREESASARVLTIIKSTDGEGYTLSKAVPNSKRNDPQLKLQLTWKLFTPDPNETSSHIIPYEAIPNQLKIFLNPVTKINKTSMEEIRHETIINTLS